MFVSSRRGTAPRSSWRASIIVVAVVAVVVALRADDCRAAEIEATEEWTLLEEGDTIPAGLHVRVDLSTGQKWAKLVDPNDDRDDAAAVAVASIAATPRGATTTTEDDGDPSRSSRTYDFAAMHRALSRLDEEARASFGGLPEPPTLEETTRDPASVRAFEERMEEIWKERQARLAELEVADVPKLLRSRVEDLEARRSSPNDGDLRARALFALEDLGAQLVDLDVARDFLTLGGWPSLVAAATVEDDDETRAAALRAAGTALKNAAEFSSWATRAVFLDGRPTTALDAAVESAASSLVDPGRSALRKPSLYALGALLRGNPEARRYLLRRRRVVDGLGAALTRTDARSARRLLTLASDLSEERDLNDDDDRGDGEDDVAAAFSAPAWCRFVPTALDVATDLPAAEEVLRAARGLSSRCRRGRTTTDWRTSLDDAERRLRAADADEEWRAELLALWREVDERTTMPTTTDRDGR